VSLTSTTFLALVAALAVAAFVAAVVLWPSLSGPGPGKVVARVGTLLLVNVLVLQQRAQRLITSRVAA